MYLALISALTACGSTATPQDSVSPDPLSPEDYQAQLTDAETALVAALDGVGAAQSPEELISQLQAATTAVTEAADRLDEAVPPDDVGEVHDNLVTALHQFAGELSQVAGLVNSQELCAASSVMATVSAQPGLERLRTTSSAFPPGTYHWGTSLPQPANQQERRLTTGQLVVDERTPGQNEFRVDNGTDHDAVVTLAQGGQPILSMYVTSKTTATAGELGDGA